MNMMGLKILTSEEAYRPSHSISREDAADRIAVMLDQEMTTYKCRDYLADGEANCSSMHQPQHRQQYQPQTWECIDRICREKMTRWCYQVTDFCKFRREAVAIGMSYLDRFLSSSSPRAQKALCSKKEYQLASMTTLYIAVKLFEPMVIDASLLATISQGCYGEDDIIDMENDILNGLDWRMNDPLVHDFISHFLAFLPMSCDDNEDEDFITDILDIARYQADIAVSDYDLSLMSNADVALAALLNSIEGIEKEVLNARSRFEFLLSISEETGLDPFSNNVNAARSRLLELYRENCGHELAQIANLTPVLCSKKEFVSESPKRLNSTGSNSPVSATKHPYSRKNSQTAKCA